MIGTAQRLVNALREMEGLPVLEWRDGYGDSGSLHLGIRVAERGTPHGRALRERGESVVTVWGASVAIVRAAMGGLRSDHPPHALRSLGLDTLVGAKVLSADWSEQTGRLTLVFSSEAVLEISPDVSSPADAEQWALESGSGCTYLVRNGPTVVEET